MPPPDPDAVRSPGRPRRTEVDRQIVEATQQLIREGGPATVSIAGVANRSGIARTTIYRRYRDREELLVAALQPVTEQGAPAADSTLEKKLDWVLERAEEVLANGIGLGGVAAVLADTDPAFSAALRRSLSAGLEPIHAQISADVDSGSLVEHADPDLLVDVLLGSYLSRVLRHGEPDRAWRSRTARLLGTLLAGQ
ncbi:MAG TPA: TetR/AcrR family transcriptional regulator [Nocardioides sp.]